MKSTFLVTVETAPQNAWKYFKVIWKSQGILFCLSCGNPVRTREGIRNAHFFVQH